LPLRSSRNSRRYVSRFRTSSSEYTERGPIPTQYLEVRTMALPKLTEEQKTEALKKAQEVRSKRAQVRADLKAGKLTLDEVLERTDDDIIGKMRVVYLLESLPRIGKVRSRQIMEEVGIDESRRVQGLGVRQKEALLKKLGK
jgi:hypothetical protein